MRVSEEKRKIHTEHGLLGIDTRWGASGAHASKMVNLLCENGALTKRNGLVDIAIFEDENANPLPINGIYALDGKIIVHAGRYLFDCGSDISALNVLKKPTRISTTYLLRDEPLNACVDNGALWLLNGNELVVLKNGSLALLDSLSPYAPTTRRDVLSTADGSVYLQGEEENLLTDRRKHTLLGKKAELSTYELDSFVSEARGFAMTCRMRVSLSDSENEAHFIGHISEKRLTRSNISAVLGGPADETYKIFEGTGTSYGFDTLTEVNIFLKSPICLTKLVLNAQTGAGVPLIRLTYGATTVYETTSLSGLEKQDLTQATSGKLVDGITLYGNSSLARISTIELLGNELYQGDVILRFESKTIDMSKGYNPVSIRTIGGESVALYLTEDGKRRKTPTVGFTNGENGTLLHIYFDAPSYVEGRSNIEITFSSKDAYLPKILLARECKTSTGKRALGLALEGGKICFTDEKIGLKYAPKSNLAQLSGEGEVTAICQMQDYVIGVYKEDKSFFVRLKDTGIEYTGAIEGVGCVGNRCAVTVNRDTLTLSSDGVYGLQGYDEYKECLRSGAVTSILREQSLKNAHLLGYDGRLYIFFDSLCLVGDTRMKTRYEYSIDQSFEYEWFMLSGIDARCSAVLDSKMYIGTKNGKIRTLSQGFLDISYQGLLVGESLVTNVNGRTELCLNAELGEQEGKEIIISNAKILLCRAYSQAESENGLALRLDTANLLNANGTIRLFSGMEIYAVSDKQEYYKAELLYLDEQQGIAITSLPIENKYLAIFKDSAQCKITLRAGEVGYKMLWEDSEVMLSDYDNMELLLVDKSPVEAIYESTRLPLGGAHLSKNLYRISFDLLPKTGTELSLGYETSRSSISKTIVLGNKFDTSALDFGAFSFGNPIERVCTLRCFERGFSYITIKLKSSSCGAFSLNGYSLVYACL